MLQCMLQCVLQGMLQWLAALHYVHFTETYSHRGGCCRLQRQPRFEAHALLPQSVLQLLQCVAVCCMVLHGVAVCCSGQNFMHVLFLHNLPCSCCSVLQMVAVCHGVLQ